MAIPTSTPATSSAPPKSSHQRIEDLHKKVDCYERRNQRRYAYVKKLLSVVTPHMEEPDISTFTATTCKDSGNEGDDGHSGAGLPLRITYSTEDHAKF
ncbi:hypothetical protein AHAS_Ahas01G0179400 [Arachis hypogaea]